jgi:hypothetical protein
MGHQLGVASVVGYVDRRRGFKDDFETRVTTGPFPLATANATGTTTTFVCANAVPNTNTNVIRNGDEFKLFTAAGVVKEEKVFTVVSQAVAGSTTVTYTPASAVASVSGDVMRRVSMDNQSSSGEKDRRLLVLGFTQARINTLTENDKDYQIRALDDAGSL